MSVQNLENESHDEPKNAKKVSVSVVVATNSNSYCQSRSKLLSDIIFVNDIHRHTRIQVDSFSVLHVTLIRNSSLKSTTGVYIYSP